jgi:hypothetical protein
MNNMANRPIIQNSTLTDENGVTAVSVATGGAVTLGRSGVNSVHYAYGRFIVTAEDESGFVPGVIYRKTTTTNAQLSTMNSDVGGTNSLKWRVEADGDTISSTGSYTSDERAKKNLAPIQYGLAEVLQLAPKSFHWWYEEDTEIKNFCVSTAQEVQAIMPEMVRDDGLDGPDGENMKAIYDKEIVAVLVKAIQELSAKVDSLQSELNTLKGQ